MTPRETELLNARIGKDVKQILKEEAEKNSMSMTEYLERLIEGTLPNRLETKMEDILAEIEKLREEIKK